MGKAARFACIFTPMVLSILSLLCLLVAFLGGLNAKHTTNQSLYRYRIDLSQFKAKVASGVYQVPGSKLVDNLLYPLKEETKSGRLQDFYNIYMWDYCSGNGGNVQQCSPHQAKYFFDPVKEWGLNNTLSEDRYIPERVDKPLNALRKGTQWLYTAYVVAFIANAVTVVVGIFAICSRVGSCVTMVASSAAAVFTFIAALTSTILFGTLVAAWSAVMKPYSTTVTLGSRVVGLDWLAVIFSVTGTLFWAFSCCCVSGRSSRAKGVQEKKVAAFLPAGLGGKRGYEHLEDQEQNLLNRPNKDNVELQDTAYTGGSGPYTGRETAYEPFRHTQT